MATDAATEADGAQGDGLCDPTLAAGNRRTERPKQAPAGARQPQARKDVKPACSRRLWHRFLHTVVPSATTAVSARKSRLFWTLTSEAL